MLPSSWSVFTAIKREIITAGGRRGFLQVIWSWRLLRKDNIGGRAEEDSAWEDVGDRVGDRVPIRRSQQRMEANACTQNRGGRNRRLQCHSWPQA